MTHDSLKPLEEDCDEIGAGWSEDTWNRTVSYLRDIMHRIWKEKGLLIDIPDIEPSRNGSIDIHWDYPEYELVINVKADETAEATFYGDNREKIKVKGTTPLNAESGELWLWLTKQAKKTVG